MKNNVLGLDEVWIIMELVQRNVVKRKAEKS